MEALRILIISDSLTFSEGLKSLLRFEPQLNVIGQERDVSRVHSARRSTFLTPLVTLTRFPFLRGVAIEKFVNRVDLNEYDFSG